MIFFQVQLTNLTKPKNDNHRNLVHNVLAFNRLCYWLFDFMKRDCGAGELIPWRWVVVSCFGQSDDESEKSFASQTEALNHYAEVAKRVKTIPCSDVRLYAKDKQGYANCMKMLIHTANGSVDESDKMYLLQDQPAKLAATTSNPLSQQRTEAAD